MARRKKASGQSVSLFPFLSILACVIGVLTLMITGLVLGQIDTPEVADLDVVEQAPKLVEQENIKAEEARQEIDTLRQAIEQARQQAGDLQQEVVRKQTELQHVLDEIAQAQADPSAAPPKPQVDKAQLDQRLAAIREELQQLQAKIKELQAVLVERKKPPDEAIVQIRPGGSGLDLEPTFIECAAGNIVIYDGPQPRRVRTADLAQDEPYLALLDRIADANKATVIFLVRDDGLGTYQAASGVARRRYARNGKLPVLGQGIIDLSLFKK